MPINHGEGDQHSPAGNAMSSQTIRLSTMHSLEER